MVDHYTSEDVIITFEEEGSGVVYNVEGILSDFSLGGGAASTDEQFLFGGKTINFQKPRDKFTLEVEGVFANTLLSFVHMNSPETAAKVNALTGKEVRSDATPVRWRIIFWFMQSSNHKKSGNTVVPGATGEVYRIICVDCKAVTFDKEFASDDMLKGTLSFEFSATDETGYPNLIEEYETLVGTTTTLTVLNTTAHRGLLTWNTTAVTWSAGTTSTRYRSQ